ncbi:hypothetical protein SDC9_170404 [bioreactor metagenome]|uniref:Uncharacterized protein n=1 Tax=bioreactor metagenome TaxID=1076179 RepID=A0A645GB57_9ZZZZ
MERGRSQGNDMVVFWSFVNGSIAVCPRTHRRGNAEHAYRHIVYDLVSPPARRLDLFQNARFFKLDRDFFPCCRLAARARIAVYILGEIVQADNREFLLPLE